MTDALIMGQADLENGTLNLEAYTDSVLTYVYFYASLGVVMFFIGLVSMSCLFTLCERQAHEIRKRYFAALLRQEMAWYDKNETGALTNKMSAYVLASFQSHRLTKVKILHPCRFHEKDGVGVKGNPNWNVPGLPVRSYVLAPHLRY
ncbi:unnamed protein product [Gongylonema pulchrum]|uniref:ABC transmembrane type-1 domain-containing protein n=1 Tax=Gongylonema pulchrum TaxID=637853 RepID=A0A183EUV2_9BILA|nr:unnamed protein product [Gongylonema pulchrum]